MITNKHDWSDFTMLASVWGCKQYIADNVTSLYHAMSNTTTVLTQD